MKNRIDTSRQKTPWDKCKNKTKTQDFISKIYKETYKNKHKKLSETNEKDLINSIKIDKCRHCESTKIVRRGHTPNGIQRFYCYTCHKTFTAVTNTIFENHKISITEWIEFLLNLFNYGSTTLISKVNKNSLNTSIYWLHKVFLILEDYQINVILSEKVYIDEMFYKVIKSDIETKNGKQLRGLSHNQYCIGIGYDGKNIIAIVEGLGKTSFDRTNDTFKKHILPNSTLIHDDEKSHRELIKDLNLVDESYKSTYLKALTDEENPLRPINHQCDLIRQFLNAHSGFDRKDLQNYLNLYCFMNRCHKNKLEKVEELLIMALTKKGKLSYRDLFKK